MAACPRHPDAPTTDLCVGCGEFVCAQCAFVASDRRVFCPSCRERLGAAEPGGPARPAAPEPPAKGAALPLQPLEVLSPVDAPSPAWDAVKSSPVAVMILAMGLVGFGCWPVALGGAALGLNELRRHFTGSSNAHTGLVVGSFLTCMAAILVRMALWQGR